MFERRGGAAKPVYRSFQLMFSQGFCLVSMGVILSSSENDMSWPIMHGMARVKAAARHWISAFSHRQSEADRGEAS